MVSAVVRHLILIAFGLWSSLALAAAGDVPASFTLDGRLFEANSSVPLNDTVTFRVQILNGDKTCVLYEETQDRATSSGYFNLQIGSINVNDPKRSGGDSHNPMSLVFQNSKPIPATGCASPHVPQPGESRFARITVIPHSTALAQTMSPDVLLDSVPNALVAETLQGSTPDDFIRADTIPELTQNAVEDLVKGDSLLYLRANSNGASLPVFSSNPSSPSAGQMWFDSSGVIKFYNGSSVQTLGVSGAGITSLTAGAGLSGGTITTSGTIALASLHGSAGTAVKTNYDVYGRVTGSTALTASDIPAMEYAGLLNSNGLSPWPTACGAAEFLRWESTTDTFVCDAVTATQITTGLGYTPVNKAGDSMSGALVVPADGLTVGTSQLVAAGGNIGIGTATPASPLDVNGLVRSVSLNVGDVSSEKTFRVSFAGVANEKVQVYWPSNTSPLTGAGRAQGLYEVTLSAGFDSGNYSGGLQKRFGLYGRATGSMTVQQTDVPFVLGATAASYAISDVMWDAANSRWYFVVANRTSNAGTISLHVRSTTPYNFPAIRAENLQITDVYDTDTTAYAQMYPTLTGSVGIGTTAPAGALDVRGTDGTIFSRNTSATAFAGMNMYNEAGVATGSIQIGGASTATQFRNNMFLGARQAGGNLVFVQGISAGEIARFDSSGRLGIGTNNPQYTLDVNGSFNATSMSLSGNIVATGGTNGSFTQNAVDAATGARSALTLQNKGTGGANEYNLVMKNAAGTTTASVAQDGTASFATSVITPALRGSTAASANLTIESTSHGTKGHILLAPNGGNVGVGTTSPGSPLTVKAAVAGNGIQLLSGTTPGTYSSSWQQTDSGTTFSNVNSDLSISTPRRFTLTAGGGGWSGAFSMGLSSAQTYAGGGTKFLNAAGSWTPSTGTGDYVGFNLGNTINQTGTATGSYTGFLYNLTETAALGTGNYLMRVQKNGSDKFVVNPAGGVGIGTSNSTAGVVIGGGNLDVGYSGELVNRSIRIWSSNSSGKNATLSHDGAGLTIDGGIGNQVLRLGGTTSVFSNISLNSNGNSGNPFSFNVSGTNRMTMDVNGNLGIGTATPSGRLHVLGGTAAASTDGAPITLTAQSAGTGADNNGGSVVLKAGAKNGTGLDGYVQAESVYFFKNEINGWNGGSLVINARRMVDQNSSTIAIPNTVINPNDGGVGIGTTAPATKLHVRTGAGASMSDILTLSGTGNSGADRGISILFQVPAGSGAAADGGRIGVAENSGSTNTYMSFSTTTSSALTEKMRISSSGYVGIGTTTVGAPLHVTTANSGVLLRLQGTNASDAVVADFSTRDGNSISLSKQLYAPKFITPSVTVQGPGVSLKLESKESDSAAAVGFVMDNTSALSTAGAKLLSVRNNGTERSFIDHAGGAYFAGNVGIGTNNPTFALDVSGDVRATGSIASWSDGRAKKNVQPLDQALEKILKLDGVSFEWRADEFPGKKFKTGRDIGVIAQNVETQFPEAVETDKNGFKSVAYQKLVAPLIEAVKTLFARDREREAQFRNHEREIASLKARNEALENRAGQAERELQATKARLDEIERLLKTAQDPRP